MDVTKDKTMNTTGVNERHEGDGMTVDVIMVFAICYESLRAAGNTAYALNMQ